MKTTKEIRIKCIDSKSGRAFIKKHHYSKTVVTNSQLHFGAFVSDKLHGVMSFGPSLDKKKLIGLVKDTPWNGFVELNRMAFDPFLIKNSESRSLSIAIKLIRKSCPHIKWIISFADAMQCGDGAIYRACGFDLSGYSSGSIWELPEDLIPFNGGKKMAHRLLIQCKSSYISKKILILTNGKNLTIENCVKQFGGNVLQGYMFRYIKILDDKCQKNYKVLPYETIENLNATMYKGKKILRPKCCGSTKEDHSLGGVRIDQAATL